MAGDMYAEGHYESTEGSIEQIDKRPDQAFGDLVASGIGDLRELTRLVGSVKTIKFDTFHGHRAELPVGGWASNVKLGPLRVTAADEVLTNPTD